VKNLVLIIIFLSIACSTEAQSNQTVFKFLPLDILEDKATFMIEKRINGKSSVAVSPGLGFNYQADSFSYTLYRNYMLDIGYRGFIGSILDDAPKKFFLGLNVRGEYTQFEYEREDTDGSITFSEANFPILGAGISAGYQLIIKDKYALDFYYNPIVHFPLPSSDLVSVNPSFDNITFSLLRLGIGIGLAFPKK